MYRAFHLCFVAIAGFLVLAGAVTTPSHTGGSSNKTPTPKPKTANSAKPSMAGKLVIAPGSGVGAVYVAPARNLGPVSNGSPNLSSVSKQVTTLLGGLTNLSVSTTMPKPTPSPLFIVQPDIIEASGNSVKQPYVLGISVYDTTGAMLARDSFPLNVDSKTKAYSFADPNYATRFQALLNRDQFLPQRHAEVLLINESQTDTQTQGTAFNGPVYAAARMIERLALLDLPAERIEDFLAANNGSINSAVANAGGNSHAVVTFNTDAAWNQACRIDPNLYAVRYIVEYAETRNPLFGTQKGHAQLNAWLQQCNQTLREADLFSSYGDATNIGSGGLLNGQYFNALNWGLGRLRLTHWKLLGTSGWWGSSGLISSALLPPTHDSDAEAAAVGIASERMICAVAYDIVDQLPRVATPVPGPSASPVATPTPVFFDRTALEPGQGLAHFKAVPICRALKGLKERIPLFRRQAEELVTPSPTP